MQSVTWQVFSQRPKKSGMEMIPIDRLKFEPNGLSISRDSKFVSIRFNNGDFRIIAYRNPKDNTILHIIGYDFNYNAYGHGS